MHAFDSIQAKLFDRVHIQEGRPSRRRYESLESTIVLCNTPPVVYLVFASCCCLDDYHSSMELFALLTFEHAVFPRTLLAKSSSNPRILTSRAQVFFELEDQRR